MVKYNNYCKYIKKDPENLYTCKKCNLEKRKNTCMEKYGVEFVAKLDSSKEKSKDTMKKNGTMLFFCNPEYKNKMLDTYGVDNPSKSEIFLDKKKKFWLEKYGVDNPSKNPDIHMKQQSGYILKHHKSELHYRGTYELHFIEYCLENNIKIENFKGTIEYEFEGRSHKYFPDFYLKEYDLVVEVKSYWTYECELEQNECKKYGSLEKGYNFIFIIDKNYKEFETYIKKDQL
jgi:hypothetical protein